MTASQTVAASAADRLHHLKSISHSRADSELELIAACLMPAGATLVGFGKGVVYVLDAEHHVERLPLH